MSDIATQLTEAKAQLAAVLALLEQIEAPPATEVAAPFVGSCDDRPGCQSCLHEDVSCDETPCLVCDEPDDQWQPKENPALEEHSPQCDTCRHKECDRNARPCVSCTNYRMWQRSAPALRRDFSNIEQVDLDAYDCNSCRYWDLENSEEPCAYCIHMVDKTNESAVNQWVRKE